MNSKINPVIKSKIAMREAEEESGLMDLKFYSIQPLDIEVQLIPEKKNHRILKFFSFQEAYKLGDKLDYALIRLINKAIILI